MLMPQRQVFIHSRLPLKKPLLSPFVFVLLVPASRDLPFPRFALLLSTHDRPDSPLTFLDIIGGLRDHTYHRHDLSALLLPLLIRQINPYGLSGLSG